MRYIRFLKTPRITPDTKKKPSEPAISCLITITSDLGETFLPYNLKLYVHLLSGKENDSLRVYDFQWQGEIGMRELPVSLPLRGIPHKGPFKLRISVQRENCPDDLRQLSKIDSRRGVISAASATFSEKEQAEKLVERGFVSGDVRIMILEETGNSIARHLWDAGVATANMIGHHDFTKFDEPLVEVLGNEGRKKHLRILELGSGCGIVGITIAKTVPNCEVILTDLAEAEEIIRSNISGACLRNDETSSLEFQVLDWDEDVPKHLEKLDLIIAADCTYNADSSPALVKTLCSLAKISPKVVIAIAMKKRHSSEDIFFDLMDAAGLWTRSTRVLALPGDEECGEEEVQIYYYRLGEPEERVEQKRNPKEKETKRNLSLETPRLPKDPKRKRSEKSLRTKRKG